MVDSAWLVVPYQYSTSNRNELLKISSSPGVVPYQYSTSNRNQHPYSISCLLLFLINILHQTATETSRVKRCFSCSLSIFYIKPQPGKAGDRRYRVVPYQYSTSNRNDMAAFPKLPKVVPYQYSTSNRNLNSLSWNPMPLFLISILHQTATTRLSKYSAFGLFLISILHQTATSMNSHNRFSCCSLSVFYIKPQLINK